MTNNNAVLLFLMLVSKVGHFLRLFLLALQGGHLLLCCLHFLSVVSVGTKQHGWHSNERRQGTHMSNMTHIVQLAVVVFTG